MKRVLSFIIAIALVLSALCSMTSCLALVDRLVPDVGGGSGDGDSLDGDGAGGSTADGSHNSGVSGEVDNPDGGTESDGITPDGGELPDGGDNYIDDYLPDSEENASLADKITDIRKTLLSTVVIISNFTVSTAYDETYTHKDSSAGSGVIYKLDREAGDAIIITNLHVVYDSYSITPNKISNEIDVYLYGQEYADYKIRATYIGGSLTEDLAVLRIENSDVLRNSCAREAELGDSDLVSVFDKVYAVGNPEGDGMAATEGTVSVESESLSMTGSDGSTALNLRVMRVSAAINQGNSGGGLYDESGRLIGIVNAKKVGSEVDNIAWAIPINLARNIVDNILDYADGIFNTSGYRALLGVTVTSGVSGVRVDADTGRLYKAETVVISSISETSILNNADGTSLLYAGDIINKITVDGVEREVYRIHHVIDHMYTARVGSTVVINITRGAVTTDVTLEIPEEALTELK